MCFTFVVPQVLSGRLEACPTTLMSDLDFNADASRGRQKRLLAEMQRLKLDLVIVQTIEHVQYLTGARFGWVFSPFAALSADGHLTLVAPKKPILDSAADEVVYYEAQ